MKCPRCGSELGVGDRFCHQCGAPRPELPTPFAETERRFADLRRRYRAGELDDATYESELQELVIDDDATGYWMLGTQTGAWYWHDGSQWVRRDPVGSVSADRDAGAPVAPPPPGPGQPPPAGGPPDTGGFPWIWVGLGGAGLFLVVLVAAGLVLAARVLGGGHRGAAPVQIVTDTPDPTVTPTSIYAEMTAAAELPTSTKPAAAPTPTATPEPTQTREPNATPTPTSSAPFSIRPYDPEADAGVEGIVERAADFAGPTEPGAYEWDAAFPKDAPALLSMGWCATDQPTLEANWEQLSYELQVDGEAIDLSQLLDTSWSADDLFCRGYKGVLTGWETKPHSVEWTQRVESEIDDGMDSYPPGDYVLRFHVDLVEALEDDFSDTSGGWLEGDYQTDRIWIEDGEYHILMKEPQRLSQIAHKEHRYADFYLSAVARLVSDAPGEYGIVFRYQDPKNTYYFRVSHNGRYRIGKRVEGESVDLVEWTSSEVINKAQSENRLWLICEGDTMTAYVNREEVATVTDDSFADGYVGLIVGSLSEPDVHVAFDRIWVEAIPTE